MGGTIISLKNHKLSKFHNFIRTIPFFFFCPFFRPTSLQNGSLPETKFVHSLTPNEDEIDSLSFPTNLSESAKKVQIWSIYVFGETISIKYDQMATMNINGDCRRPRIKHVYKKVCILAMNLDQN